MSNPTIEQLAGKLASANVDERREAAESLMRLGAEAQGAAVALCLATSDADEVVREFASAALEESGPPRLADCLKLAGLLATASPDAAYWAATLLGRAGPAASPQSAALAQSLATHAESSVRQRCAWALGQIGPAADQAVSALEDAARTDDPRLVRLAQAALKSICGR